MQEKNTSIFLQEGQDVTDREDLFIYLQEKQDYTGGKGGPGHTDRQTEKQTYQPIDLTYQETG